MTVTPRSTHLFQTRRELHHFLSRYKQISEERTQPQIVSLSMAMNAVDPLVVFQALAEPQQLNFYMEKRSFGQEVEPQAGVAIAAIGSAAKLTVNGAERFTAAQQFIRSTLAHTAICGQAHLPLAGPHFFCSFTFFDQDSDRKPAFPAATIFLPEWQISRNGSHCLVVANVVLCAATNLEETVDRLWQTRLAIRAIRYELVAPPIEHQDLLTRRDVATTQHFKQAVRAALTNIQQATFHKIVLAHAVDVISPLPFDAIAALHRLRKLYPGCYLFSTSNDRGQQFIGASPERLVSVRDGQLKTGALAGSAPRGKTTSADAALAKRLLESVKERHEHRVVSQFICQQLAQLGLSSQSSPVRLLQLSNIQHLQTPIHATVPAEIHLLDVVAALHPTPAVAGMPRAAACDYIRRYETFERSLYAAPIGWVDHHGNGEFAVGIRSALLNGCTARLFAGAGIVEGSDPERELAEVQLKLQALLQALV
ncbi:Isochorismate synthase @ Phylloquinone-specific isochorismate synthase [uncultured Leptolyngbya sp.]|uniref:isochorismate synthase n=1 Tax=uncultured Leptolyngbya sp. TaxID=332963 RepID=A0A6J4L358_9CYAN|nr:Isochorismate synthase @ Phylloquinone-specific isochorismate synthase [uncultured Leptolyngbya sp.]